MESITLYKLMILYMLRKVNFPLTNSQITGFFLEKDYTDYFHVQRAVNDLTDAKLVSVEKVRNASLLTATVAGEETLEYFTNEIPLAIKREIESFLRENAFELRNESCTVADYEQTSDGGYAVHCRVTEGHETLIELTINVPSEEEANRVCENWPKKSQEIYADIMMKLL